MSGLVGVLALQGDFASHQSLLSDAGVATRQVRCPEDLEGLSALLLPGGESTTISMGIDREGLRAPLIEFANSGKPVFGTCAGLVLMGNEHLGMIDIEVDRNAFGRQIKSFEADVTVTGIGAPPVRALFIRAPIVRSHGDGVEVLAQIDGATVAVRQGNCTAISFHPELVHDARIHMLALDIAVGANSGSSLV